MVTQPFQAKPIRSLRLLGACFGVPITRNNLRVMLRVYVTCVRVFEEVTQPVGAPILNGAKINPRRGMPALVWVADNGQHSVWCC